MLRVCHSNFYLILISTVMNVTYPATGSGQTLAKFDVQGHRGCRGLMPENTIAGFIKAVQLGVTTIEMDVVIAAGEYVLVSHEPYFSGEICIQPNGEEIRKDAREKFNIFQMSMHEIKQFDCGSKIHDRFPLQAKFAASKPLLEEVITAVEAYTLQNNYTPVYYNIELKCSKAGDEIFHPLPDVFANMVMGLLLKHQIEQRTIIQSFDTRPLQYLKQKHPDITLALLVENNRGIKQNLAKLGFNPDIYSPYYRLLSKNKVDQLHRQGIRVIPWTINDERIMKKMISAGVDGIITDYPDKLSDLINDRMR